MKKFSIFNFPRPRQAKRGGQFSFSKGFTLIELLIVISIIGILSSFLLSNFVGVRQRARDGQRKSDLAQIQSALEFYRADQGSYPTSAQFPTCGSSFTGGSPVTTYMQKVPCDPKNSAPYVYTYSPSGSPPSTYSLIACLENTNDKDKDATNNALCTAGRSYTRTNP